ncbi:MAG TPA: ABC transporter permease [Bryobacteraceae bacterium]|nr:ABC transporter permease [Bryobacteraceae bacterium]
MRYAVKTLCAAPLFSLTAIAALAVGIGANAAIFSLVNAVLLRPIPFPGSTEIVVFENTSPQGSAPRISPAKFNELSRGTSAFQDLSAYRRIFINLTGVYPEQIECAEVSARFFNLFGASAVIGRTFTDEEQLPNGGHFVVLSYRFWQHRFGLDPQIVGKTMPLNGEPHTIVGVLSPNFQTEDIGSPIQSGGATSIDAFTPLQLDRNSADQSSLLDAAARLQPGTSLAEANRQLERVAEDFRRVFPGVLGPKEGLGVRFLKDGLVSNARASILVLLAAVTMVLLIACANVANLLLVRSIGRRREVAIRAALGASRGRIVRQLLAESTLLAIAGGSLGLLLGYSGLRTFLGINPALPRLGLAGSAVTIDLRVLAYTLVVSLLTGIAFGLIPAVQASRGDLHEALRASGGRSGSGYRHNKARSFLVLGEIALSLMLLVGATLLIRTFMSLHSVNAGFDPHNILTMRMSLTDAKFQKTSAVSQLVRDAEQRVGAVPGAVAIAYTGFLPLEGGYIYRFIIDGRPLSGPFHGRAHWKAISPAYFSVFKIPILQGRAFSERDNRGAPPVVIINQAMARQFWPKTDPIGDRLIIGKGVGPAFADEPARQIVGVAGDVRDDGLNVNPFPEIYVPAEQLPDGLTALMTTSSSVAWAARTRVEPYSISALMRNQLVDASGGLPIARVRSMDDIVARSTARQHLNMLLLTVFGCVALLLATIGVYGVVSYGVQQRIPELGIRVALGASSTRIRNLVLLQGLRLAVIGVAIGLAGAFVLTRFIASFLFGVKSRDPLTFVAVPAVVCVINLVAIWLPARRAARTDPVSALKNV